MNHNESIRARVFEISNSITLFSVSPLLARHRACSANGNAKIYPSTSINQVHVPKFQGLKERCFVNIMSTRFIPSWIFLSFCFGLTLSLCFGSCTICRPLCPCTLTPFRWCFCWLLRHDAPGGQEFLQEVVGNTGQTPISDKTMFVL